MGKFKVPLMVAVGIVLLLTFVMNGAYQHGVTVTKAHYEKILSDNAAEYAKQRLVLETRITEIESDYRKTTAVREEQYEADTKELNERLSDALDQYSNLDTKYKRVYVDWQRALGAAETAQLGTDSIRALSQRKDELSSRTIEFLIHRTGQLDRVAMKFNHCSDQLQSTYDAVDKYNKSIMF